MKLKTNKSLNFDNFIEIKEPTLHSPLFQRQESLFLSLHSLYVFVRVWRLYAEITETSEVRYKGCNQVRRGAPKESCFIDHTVV